MLLLLLTPRCCCYCQSVDATAKAEMAGSQCRKQQAANSLDLAGQYAAAADRWRTHAQELDLAAATARARGELAWQDAR